MALTQLKVRGFKTLKSLEFEPRNLSVLIGTNGAGKSNVISFFRLLSYLINGDLQEHVGMGGGASKILHDGPESTETIRFELSFESDTGVNTYEARLGRR